jgi:hypothetical protein
MSKNWFRRAAGAGIFLICSTLTPLLAQPQKTGSQQSSSPASAQSPDAERTKQQLAELFQKYPPNLRNVLALDPNLLANRAYLQPYPVLLSFFDEHPEIARNPSFFIGSAWIPQERNMATEMVQDVLAGLAAFAAFSLAIGLLVWLIRTLIDYKRWSRLARVQTDVHTKLMDRLTANEDLMAYMKSPAGATFLESSPITLDAGPRSVGAPLGRILWSLQGGVVLIAGGIGLQFVSGTLAGEATAPLNAIGIIAIALGLGFIVSALISFVISKRLGLIDSAAAVRRVELPGV